MKAAITPSQCHHLSLFQSVIIQSWKHLGINPLSDLHVNMEGCFSPEGHSKIFSPTLFQNLAFKKRQILFSLPLNLNETCDYFRE